MQQLLLDKTEYFNTHFNGLTLEYHDILYQFAIDILLVALLNWDVRQNFAESYLLIKLQRNKNQNLQIIFGPI